MSTGSASPSSTAYTILVCTLVSIIHAQFTPIGVKSASSTTIDGQGMYIVGGLSTVGDPSPLQAFMIDLTVSWSSSAPAYRKLSSGPMTNGSPSVISSDGQWLTVVNQTCYAYNFQSANWSPLITNNAIIQEASGYAAAMDTATGMIYVPNMYRGSNGRPWTLVLDVTTRLAVGSPMYPPLEGAYGYALVWSAATKSMYYFGGTVDGLFNFPPLGMWSSLVTKGTAPTPRMNPCLASVNDGNRLILAGGTSKTTNASLNDLYFFDVKTLTWTPGPSLVQTSSRNGPACGLSNNQLIVWGGADSNQDTTNSHPMVFNITSNTWTTSYVAPPPKPNGSPSTSGSPQASDGVEPTLPGSTPFTNPTNSNSSLVVILGSVVGALVVALIAGGLVYYFRSKKARDATGDQGSSPPDTGYPEDLGYIPPPPSRNVPYPLPPAPAQANNWTTNSPQRGTNRNPAEVVAPKQQRGVQSTPNRIERVPNAPQDFYGMQRDPQHPHAIPGQFEGQGHASDEMYEMENISQQAFINRRNPAEFDHSAKIYHESMRLPQHPHTNIDQQTTGTGMTAYHIPGSFFQHSD